MDIRKYARIFLNIAVPLMTIYLICVWGPRLLGFFIPFVIGWVVAMIANPLVRFLEKKIRIVRRHSSMVLIVGVLALVILRRWCCSCGPFRDFMRRSRRM